MKTNRNQTGRLTSLFFFRHPSGSPLLQLILLFSLLIPLPACLFCSCNKNDVEGGLDLVEIPVDSCSICLRFNISDHIADTTHSIVKLDLLLYSADGIKPLVCKRCYDYLPDSVKIYCPRTEMIAVALANYPFELFRAAPERYDGAEQLNCSFEDDSPSQPIMSGVAVLGAGASGTVTLKPLMARIMLGIISNNMKKYVRLEDPRIYLESANAGAEILREGGFRPAELLQAPQKEPLPYDIGVFPQSPGTQLYCYPNDSPEATIGTPATVLVLECEIKGATEQFRVSLPSIRRNTTTRVDISVDGPGKFESKIY